MPDIAAVNSINPIDYFRAKIRQSNSRVSMANMSRALEAFCEFAGGSDIAFCSFNRTLLENWVAYMLFRGYYVKTAAYYVKKIAALYNKAVADGLAAPAAAFSEMQALLGKPLASRFDGASGSDVFDKLQKLVRKDYSAVPGKQLAKDVLLFAVYCGGLTFEDIASYRKDGYKGDDRRILEIVERYSRPKNKYLFPLEQIRRTSRQMALTLERMLSEVLQGVNLTLSVRASDTALDLWCLSAMSCGVPVREIAACALPRKSSCAVTAFVTPAHVSDGRISEIRDRVIATLADNPLRWYAMHFRRNVDFGMIAARLKEKGLALHDIYYPMEEILHKLGHRKVFESRPVISWLLFFRARVSELDCLFHEIGDLAWGYRQSPVAGSPYTAISDVDIAEYRNAIGTLDSDVRLLKDDELQFSKGDCLVILGGPLNGRRAIFESEIRSDRKRIVYRLRLCGGDNLNWIVDWDPRLVRKITARQSHELDGRLQSEIAV